MARRAAAPQLKLFCWRTLGSGILTYWSISPFETWCFFSSMRSQSLKTTRAFMCLHYHPCFSAMRSAHFFIPSGLGAWREYALAEPTCFLLVTGKLLPGAPPDGPQNGPSSGPEVSLSLPTLEPPGFSCTSLCSRSTSHSLNFFQPALFILALWAADSPSSSSWSRSMPVRSSSRSSSPCDFFMLIYRRAISFSASWGRRGPGRADGAHRQLVLLPLRRRPASCRGRGRGHRHRNSCCGRLLNRRDVGRRGICLRPPCRRAPSGPHGPATREMKETPCTYLVHGVSI